MSIIFQDPVLALHPLIRAGDQVIEVLRAHHPLGKKEAAARVLKLLGDLGFEDATRIFHSFPHQLSGGQCQRVAIAQALICKPDLVIADEPTASLDAESAQGVIQLLRRLRQQHSFALLVISHDPAVLRSLSERIIVLRDGGILEQGTSEEVLHRPRHQYTQLLISVASGDLLTLAPVRGRPHDASVRTVL
jgi:ABC-type dipeptide/oligopeptide/nickel transport system ATPase component